MTEKKWPDASAPEPRSGEVDRPAVTEPTEDGDGFFLPDDEHDGWGPIVKRRPSEPPKET